MFRLLGRLLFAAALFGSPIAAAADLDVGQEQQVELRQGRIPRGGPVYAPEGELLFWRAYGWPGGQAGPCWRLWYGQWVWSC
jgi:hypothetical protein